MKKVLLALALVTSFIFSVPQNVLAGRGCCSWHGGQSYCDTSVGRWVCADGTYSPSCTCTRIITPVATIRPATPKPTIPPTVAPTATPAITPTPTEVPTISPTNSPEVKAASTETVPTPTETPKPLTAGETATATGVSAGVIYGGVKLLKWIWNKIKNPFLKI